MKKDILWLAARESRRKAIWATVGTVALALALFGAMHWYNVAKARRLNDVYGTHFTAWDMWLGVEKNYREIQP